MITEQLLDEMEVRLRLAAEVTLPSDYARELFRLARLGIWAEKVGTAALRYNRNEMNYRRHQIEGGYHIPMTGEMTVAINMADEALAQLPKQGEE